MRIILIVVGILAIAAIGIGLYLWLAPAPQQQETQGIAFPQAEDRALTESEGGVEYPDRWEGYVEVTYEPPTVSQEPQAQPVTHAPAPQQRTSFTSLINMIAGRFAPQPYTPPPSSPAITGDIGVSYTPNPSAFVPSVGVSYPGGAGTAPGASCERFNASTGDICINGQRFNFTKDVTGATLGAYVGALINNPSLGSTLATMLTSNLEDGRTLAELDIEIKDGIPYFGGYNSLAQGGIFDGGAGPGSGSANRFEGYMFAYECTCAESFTLGILVAPATDSGVYLSHGLSLGYQDRNRRGFFHSEGRYHAGVSNSCRTRVSGTCQTVPTTRGVMAPFLF